jgi:hypothetical protein
MSGGKFQSLIIDYTNDLELIETILTIYGVGKKKPIRDFEMRCMKYYIKYGYNEMAKQYIIEDEGRTEGDIKQADHHLRKKGYLELGEKNQRKSTLSEDMRNIRYSFVEKEDKSNIYILAFKQLHK